jgi:hypothetical protein
MDIFENKLSKIISDKQKEIENILLERKKNSKFDNELTEEKLSVPLK